METTSHKSAVTHLKKKNLSSFRQLKIFPAAECRFRTQPTVKLSLLIREYGKSGAMNKNIERIMNRDQIGGDYEIMNE